MGKSAISVSHYRSESYCDVHLHAEEISQFKLDLNVTELVELKTETSQEFDYAMIRYLCGNGVAHARRRLKLPGGLVVNVERLSGIIAKGLEVGVSLAVAIAVAAAIGKNDYRALLDNPEEWTVTIKKYDN